MNILIRPNPCYRTQFVWDERGLLLVTKRRIYATKVFARCWAF
jgi:hypothetical protein